MEEEKIEKLIKDYIKNNLAISIDSETNDFMTTDGTRTTRLTVTLLIDNEEIDSSHFTI